MTPRETLIGYGMSFSSFLMDSPVGRHINKIVLFGSVARGDFTEESDLDLFIDADEKHEKAIEKELSLFKQSKINETWALKDVMAEISLKIGLLEAWKLKREVISSGILLYGKYSELPKDAKYYLLIRINDMANKKTSEQVMIWRRLYGYRQKVGKKTYAMKGLIDLVEGKKLAKGISIVPMEKRGEIIKFLNKHAIQYKLHEVWSDSFG